MVLWDHIGASWLFRTRPSYGYATVPQCYDVMASTLTEMIIDRWRRRDGDRPGEQCHSAASPVGRGRPRSVIYVCVQYTLVTTDVKIDVCWIFIIQSAWFQPVRNMHIHVSALYQTVWRVWCHVSRCGKHKSARGEVFDGERNLWDTLWSG